MSKKALLVVTTLLIIFSLTIYAQPKGLIFSGHEAAQEKRTSLELSTEGPLCLSGRFELSFALSFTPNRAVYFGYIFRLLNEHRQNIDLVYSEQDSLFNVILGETLTGIHFRIDREQLFGKQSQLRLELRRDTLSFFVNGALAGKAAAPLKDHCFRIVFGASNLNDLKSTDLPPMQLSSIAIVNDGRLRYYWPLGESSGNVAKDSLQGRTAMAVNPVWAADLFTRWQRILSCKVNGNASIAFDSAKEELYMVGKDTIYRFSLTDKTLSGTALTTGEHYLVRGNQSFFHPLQHTLYNLIRDQQHISAFNSQQRRWEDPVDTGYVTAYWHYNRFFAASQNALYLLGGYGQLKYKNQLTRYRFADQVWEDLPLKGDFYMPRYLAALGATPKGDTAYILGGYGSTSGDQILNPKYLYDLLLFDVNRQSFRKVYSLPVPASPFVFANSMILDTATRSYYAFAFPNDRFNSHLQLIRGSLDRPEYTTVGDTIPYVFQDNRSYADLFYCPASKLLLAVTLHDNANGETSLGLFTIGFPPDKLLLPAVRSGGIASWMLWGMLGLLLLLMPFLFLKTRNRTEQPEEAAAPVAPVMPALSSQEEAPAVPLVPAISAARPSVSLFGTFTVTDHTGADISRSFTPLLKELFLLIVIYTVKKGRGISPEDLHEILWNDKSGDAAKNNRAVNMRKLKNILEQLGDEVVLKKQSGKWVLQYPEASLDIDLVRFLQLVNGRGEPNGPGMRELLNIVKRGAFLHHTDYQWLDDIKSDISNKVLDVLIHAGSVLTPAKDATLLIEMADGIFCFDAVNEQALRLKCTSLVVLGRHTLAKNAYEKFVKEYRHMYDEDFPESFNNIIA